MASNGSWLHRMAGRAMNFDGVLSAECEGRGQSKVRQGRSAAGAAGCCPDPPAGSTRSQAGLSHAKQGGDALDWLPSNAPGPPGLQLGFHYAMHTSVIEALLAMHATGFLSLQPLLMSP